MKLNPYRTGAAEAENLDNFSRHRGRFISLWATLESGMDKANYYAWIYSDHAVAAAVPVSLSRKITLFKRVNRDLLPFEPLKEQAASLIERVDDLVEDRHWMAHGYVYPRKCTKGSWLLIRHGFLRETGGLIDLERTFTDDDMLALSKKVVNLTNDFADYINALAAQVVKHGPNDNRS